MYDSKPLKKKAANDHSSTRPISEKTIRKTTELGIVEVVSSDIKIKSNKACCPFHDEKTASFNLAPKKNIYKCFGCGAGGGPIEWVKKFHRKNFYEAVLYLCEKFNIEIEFDDSIDIVAFQQKRKFRKELVNILVEVSIKYYQAIHKQENAAALNYLVEQRGLTLEAVKEWNLGFAPNDIRFITPGLVSGGKLIAGAETGICVSKDGKNYDFYRNGIIIPIHNEHGELVGFAMRAMPGNSKAPKYLNPKETVLYQKSNIWFGLFQAVTARAFSVNKTSSPFVYVTEGYFDVITCHEAGLINTVCACGTAITPSQIKKLKKYVNHVVLMLDGDSAGINSAIKNIDSFLQEDFRVEVIELPDGKDPDEFFRTVEINTDHNSIEEVLPKKEDAVIWKASKLLNDANTIDDKAMAIDQIVLMLLCISSTVKQSAYVETLQKKFSIKNQLLKKEVKQANERKESAAKHAADKAIIEGKSIRNEDAGLPEDYKGEISPFLKYGVYAYKNVYWSKGKAGVYSISNFIMKILFHIDSNRDQAYKIISVTNEYGYNVVFSINTDDYITLGGFKKALARKGNFVFKGNDSDLSRLQEYLQETQLDSKAIDVLGYNKRFGFYAFSNGIIPLSDTTSIDFIKSDETGILTFNQKAFYLPAFSKMYEEKDEMYLNEKKFIYQLPDNTISVNEWMQLFTAAYGEKSIAAILFYIGCLFRDILLSIHKCFPLLNMYGQRGSGKGKMADSIMRMFGEPQDQIMLGGETTGKAFMRKLSQFKNAIVCLDEYKNSLPAKLIENLKNIFDSIGYMTAKMSNDNQTNYFPILSGCLLLGQEMPTVEPALYTRVIMLTFEPGKFSDEQRKAFVKIKRIEEDGLSYLTAQILAFRNLFEQSYQEQYDRIFKEFIKEVNDPEIDDRMIMNVSMLATIYNVLRDQISFPFSYGEMKNFLITNLKYQASILKGNDDVAKWWQVVEQLAHLKLIMEGRDYLLEDGFLFIRLRTVHPLYLKELRSRGDNHFLSISTLENYIKSDKSTFISSEKKKSFDGLYTTCYQVVYEKLGIDLIQNSSSPFTPQNSQFFYDKSNTESQDLLKDELPFG